MTGTDDLDRQLRAMLDATAPRREPESLFASVMASTRTARQRPAILVALQQGSVGTTPRARSRVGLAVLVVLLLAALLGALALVGSRVIQPPAPVGPRLAIAYDDGLVIADGDGTDPRRVRDDGVYAAAAWSSDAGHVAAIYTPTTSASGPALLRILAPDGTLVGEVPDVLAFQWVSSTELVVQGTGSANSLYHVRVVKLDGLIARDLGSWLATDIVFKHDGTGFVSVDAGAGRLGEKGGGSGRIMLHDSDGALDRQLVRIDLGRLSLPAWDPSDREVAYLDTSASDCVTCGGLLKIVSSGDGSIRMLADKAGMYARPAWEPDGSRILFTRWIDGQWDLWVVDADGSRPVQLTDDAAEEQDASWSTRGDRILFTSGEGRAREVWSIAPDGSDARMVASGAVATAVWQPLDAAIDVGVPRESPAPDSTSDAPSVAPSGTSRPTIGTDEPWIVFEATVSAARDGTFLMREDGSGIHRIATGVPGSHKHPDWSPDGLRIALISENDDSIWIAEVDGSAVEQVVTCHGGCDFPAWSPDGRTLAFTEYENDPTVTAPTASSIKLIDLGTRAITSVVREERPLLVDVARWSPDGSQLVVGVDQLGPAADETGAAIAVVPAAGGDLRYLTGLDTFAYHPDWSWVTDTIVYGTDVRKFRAPQQPGDDTGNLFTIRPDGTGSVQVTSVPAGQRLGHASWTPDGTRIIAIDQGTRAGVFVDPASGAVTTIGGLPMTHPRLRSTSR
jgi:Tol biopolymer transport system component